MGLNGGAGMQHNEAFSFQIAADDQAETDVATIAAARGD